MIAVNMEILLLTALLCSTSWHAPFLQDCHVLQKKEDRDTMRSDRILVEGIQRVCLALFGTTNTGSQFVSDFHSGPLM
jgi:hypothetical protein